MRAVNRNGLTVAAFAGFILVAFGALALPRTIFEIGRLFLWTGAAKGNLFSGYGVGFIVGALVSGSLAGSVGRKPLAAAALVLSTLGHLLFGYLGPLPLGYRYFVLLVLNVGIGSGIGMLEGVLNALLVDLHPGRAPLFLNVGHGFFSVGAAVAPFTAGYLMKISWQWVFYLNAVVSLVLVVAFAVMVWPSSGHIEKLRFRNVMRLVRNWGFLIAVVSIALVVGAELGLMSWIVEFIRVNRSFNISAVGVGLFLSYLSLAMLVGRFGYGFFAERVGSIGALVVSGIGSGVCIALFLLVNSLPGAVVFVVLFGLFISGMNATLIAYACEKFPERVGTVSGLMTAAIGTGSAVFPNAIGRIADAAGLGIGLWICAVNLFIVAAIMLFVLGARNRAGRAAGTAG